MLDHGNISTRQFTRFVISVMVGGNILYIPSMCVHYSHQDGWLVAVAGLFISLLLVLLYNKLSCSFPGETLVQYSEKLLGQWLGKAVSLLFSLYFFIVASILVREVGDFLTTEIMPETPIEAIHLLFLLLIIGGVSLGLEPLGRAAELLFPWTYLLFFIMLAFLSPKIRPDHLKPMFENGIVPLTRAIYPFLGLSSMQFCVALMFIPFLTATGKQNYQRAFYHGTTIGSLMILLITLYSLLVFGSGLTKTIAYPSFALAKEINVANFVTRIEVLLMFIWIVTVFFKVCLFLFATCLGLAQIFRLADYRSLLFPVGSVTLGCSILFLPNISYLSQFSDPWFFHSLLVGVIIPLVLLGLMVPLTMIFASLRL